VTEMSDVTSKTSPTAAAPVLDELSQKPGQAMQGDAAGLSMLFDLNMEVSIVLGRTTMTVQEILGLGRGSVIQLDRSVGEPVDVYIGDRRFAEGEVVVLGEQFGVRITRIVAQAAVAGGGA